MHWNLIWKSPRFVPFGANLTHFGVKLTIPESRWREPADVNLPVPSLSQPSSLRRLCVCHCVLWSLWLDSTGLSGHSILSLQLELLLDLLLELWWNFLWNYYYMLGVAPFLFCVGGWINCSWLDIAAVDETEADQKTWGDSGGLTLARWDTVNWRLDIFRFNLIIRSYLDLDQREMRDRGREWEISPDWSS